jgi:hypothetical protein
MSSYDASPQQNAWWPEIIVKDTASCSPKKLIKHALLHMTWDEPHFLRAKPPHYQQPRALGISARHDLQ